MVFPPRSTSWLAQWNCPRWKRKFHAYLEAELGKRVADLETVAPGRQVGEDGSGGDFGTQCPEVGR